MAVFLQVWVPSLTRVKALVGPYSIILLQLRMFLLEGPTGAKHRWVLSAGMNASVGLGYVDEAAKLLRMMQNSGMRADVRAYNILLKGYASARNLGAMQATLAEMERLQVAPSLVTYNILIDAFVNEGRLEQARVSVYLRVLS